MEDTEIGFLGWIGRAWRLFGTALSFTTFGVGGLVLGLLVFPLFFVFVRDKDVRQQLSRKVIGHAFAAFVWLMKSLGVLSYEIRGTEFMSDVNGTLIIANHPSLIDVVFLVSFFPQSECVVKRAVTINPFMRGTVMAANYISNRDPEQMLEDCTARLRQGSSLILFPEGTRRDQDAPLKFKLGAAAVAVRAAARILPVLIDCTPPTLRKGEPWYHIPRTRPHWTFEVRPPLRIEDLVGDMNDQRQATKNLQAALLDYYRRNLS